MTASTQRLFDKEAFQLGLQNLSTLIAASEVLAAYRPIKMIATGGYVSVSYLGNRKSTKDLDYFLNQKAYGERFPEVRSEMNKLVSSVANKLHYDEKWCNDEVSVFLTLLDDPVAFFDRSRSQDTVLYRDDNLVVYAVLWEWLLARKLKRLQMEDQRPRQVDWNDSVTIAMLLYKKYGRMSKDILKDFDHPEKEPPVLDKTISQLRRLTGHLYHTDPFLDDETL